MMKGADAWLETARRTGRAHPFIRACEAANIVPGIREAKRWLSGRGRALDKAWELWPSSKSLRRRQGP